MTILHVSAVNNWGGGEHHIENLCNELAQTNPEVKNYVLCVKGAPFHKRLLQTEINFIPVTSKIKIDPRYIFSLIKHCRTKKVDLLHIHDTSALQLAIIADKIYSLPPFVFSKKTSFPIKERKKTLYKYNYPKIKKILCVSKETEKVTAKAIKDKEKLLTIYHGTNLKTKSTETPFKIREKYNIPIDKVIVGNIGNHIRAKHLETLVNMVHHIVITEKRKEFLFVQIGTFTDRTEALLEDIKRLGIEDYIIFMGYTPKAANFIPQFDISLMTSQSEGLPQFIYESMFHKTPIVSTDVGGIPEVIEHGENGLLAPKHDYKALSEHLVYLNSSLDLQKQFTAKSHAILLGKFTTENMAKNTLAVYKNIKEKEKHS